MFIEVSAPDVARVAASSTFQRLQGAARPCASEQAGLRHGDFEARR